jgi:hypothetical protein
MIALIIRILQTAGTVPIIIKKLKSLTEVCRAYAARVVASRWQRKVFIKMLKNI